MKDAKLLVMLLLLGASMALGLWLAWRHLRRQRPRPVPVAVHLLLGLAGLQAFVMVRRGAPDGTVLPAGPVADAAGLALALTFLTGLLVSLLGRHWARGSLLSLLAGHALLGVGGFGLFVVWWRAA